jgi:hypothetical protein
MHVAIAKREGLFIRQLDELSKTPLGSAHSRKKTAPPEILVSHQIGG